MSDHIAQLNEEVTGPDQGISPWQPRRDAERAAGEGGGVADAGRPL